MVLQQLELGRLTPPSSEESMASATAEPGGPSFKGQMLTHCNRLPVRNGGYDLYSVQKWIRSRVQM
jgi:hypothetical protein